MSLHIELESKVKGRREAARRVRALGRFARLLAPLLLVAGCSEPGPLSAAAKGRLPPAPEPPAWSEGVRGQSLGSAFPGAFSCLGAVDLLADRYANARKVIGWAWNASEGAPVVGLVAVDEQDRIVGFGEAGVPRPDVPQAVRQVRSDTTGWELVTWAPPRRQVRIYGIDAVHKSACLIGQIEITR